MPRIPALDGLRGVAVALVVAYHLGVAKGGHIGVTVFFVLSGFLITGILLRGDEAGGVDWRRFYLRRAARLLPGLGLFLVAYVAVGGPVSNAVKAATYTSNLWAAGGENLGAVHHSWSLAVEEHFYLLWPALLVAIPARWRLRATAALVVAATTWRAWLIQTADWERVYYATDTAAFALLAGCLLAVAHHDGARLPARWGLQSTLGIVALAFADVGLWGGFAVVALSVMAIGGSLRSVPALELAPLRELGVVSYGVYLWHPLVFVFAPSATGVALALALAWASWRFFEAPILRLTQGPARRPGVAPSMLPPMSPRSPTR